MVRPDFNLIQVFKLVIIQLYEVQIKRKHKRYDQHFPLYVYGIVYNIKLLARSGPFSNLGHPFLSTLSLIAIRLNLKSARPIYLIRSQQSIRSNQCKSSGSGPVFHACPNYLQILSSSDQTETKQNKTKKKTKTKKTLQYLQTFSNIHLLQFCCHGNHSSGSFHPYFKLAEAFMSSN